MISICYWTVPLGFSSKRKILQKLNLKSHAFSHSLQSISFKNGLLKLHIRTPNWNGIKGEMHIWKKETLGKYIRSKRKRLEYDCPLPWNPVNWYSGRSISPFHSLVSTCVNYWALFWKRKRSGCHSLACEKDAFMKMITYQYKSRKMHNWG